MPARAIEKLTNANVDPVRRGHDHGADDQHDLAKGRNILATKEIGEGADEGAQGGIGDQIANYHPHPSPVGRASNITIDVRQDATVQIQGDLGSDPEERHGHEREEQAGVHL